MDFAWNAEQLDYKNAAIRFAQKEPSQLTINPRLAAMLRIKG